MVLPIYYGLAIVGRRAHPRRSTPELAALLDHLESHEGQAELVELAERIRVDEAIFTQAWIRMLEQQVDRSADRYLGS